MVIETSIINELGPSRTSFDPACRSSARVSGRAWFVLVSVISSLVLVSGCRGKDTPAEEATVPVVDEPADTPAAEVVEPPKPSYMTPAPTRIRPEDRFVHPELVEAIQVRSGLIPPQPPRVDGLLLRSDLRQVLAFGGAVEVVGLAGREPSPTYNAMRMAMDQGYGCAVQRWRFDSPSELEVVYQTFTESLREPKLVPRVDVASTTSAYDGIESVAFRHSASRSMVYLTCDAAMADADQLQELVTRIALRL